MNKYFQYLLAVLFLFSCDRGNKEKKQNVFYGNCYYNGEFKNTTVKSLDIINEDLSNKQVIKKNHIIKGLAGGDRIYILWRNRFDNKVFLEANPKRLYGVQCISAYVTSFLRYYMDSSYIHKDWTTFEDVGLETFFDNSERTSSTSGELITIRLQDIYYKKEDTLYLYHHILPDDVGTTESFLIDQNLNIHQIAIKLDRGIEYRYEPQE